MTNMVRLLYVRGTVSLTSLIHLPRAASLFAIGVLTIRHGRLVYLAAGAVPLQKISQQGQSSILTLLGVKLGREYIAIRNCRHNFLTIY